MKCSNCGLRNVQQNQCMLFQRHVNPLTDYCSFGKSELIICAGCGVGLLNPIWINQNGKYYPYCDTCANKK